MYCSSGSKAVVSLVAVDAQLGRAIPAREVDWLGAVKADAFALAAHVATLRSRHVFQKMSRSRREVESRPAAAIILARMRRLCSRA